ncbi:cap-specific mRNA (nucleoside-2'-O-)-methyltransferase 2 isoform X1 [Procambarus clarkii]|uniref:cap-specific mRNA (nucleoside-2'-O-)-methyltransferase 2 isoform X1 n=2 Tax=Procambarus clarkii TaxID=6728 RepID=UPI0037448FCC
MHGRSWLGVCETLKQDLDCCRVVSSLVFWRLIVCRQSSIMAFFVAENDTWSMAVPPQLCELAVKIETEDTKKVCCLLDMTMVKDRNGSEIENREKRSIRPQETTPLTFSKPKSKRRHHDNQRSRGLLGKEGFKFPLLEYTDHMKAQMEVETHFSKHFTFTKPSEMEGNDAWTLPAVETMYTQPSWQDETLQAMKISLNKTKEQLSDKDIEVWHSHTNNTNPTQKVSYAIRRHAQPEMVTQAWLKFYEIVNAYPIIPPDAETGSQEDSSDTVQQHHSATLDEEVVQFNSVHLCEAPGAFILALNHYLALNRSSLKWQWLGNTLNPYYEGTSLDQCIAEDRFIYLTLKKWSFGKDNTGDLMVRDNLDSIVQDAQCLGPVHLVTADGSFDCQANPAEQEKMTHPLHLCEVVGAMCLLAPGGSLVVKKFTLFESETLSLVYLLCCVFERVHLYKPGTSKQGNSEVYAIAINYCGKDNCSEHLNKLLEVYGPDIRPESMFAQEDIPEDFMQQMRQCANMFMCFQVSTIERNLMLFQSMPEWEKQYNELLKNKATAFFFEQNYCVPIPVDKTITDGNVNKSRHLLDSDWNKTGSAMLMRSNCVLSKLEILKQFIDCYIKDYSNLRPGHDIKGNKIVQASASFSSQHLEKIEFERIRGKPFHYIDSSKFCSERVIRIYRELHRAWEKLCSGGKIVCDDSLLDSVLCQCPGAQVLRGEAIPGPHSGCRALEQALVLLEKGDVSVGGSIVLLDVPLLSRLQYGLLLVLGSAFKQVQIYTSQEVGKQLPVLVLDGLQSLSCREAVVHALHHAGWSPDGGSGGAQGFLQIVALPSLMVNEQLQAMFHYNIHHSIHLALAFYKNATMQC